MGGVAVRTFTHADLSSTRLCSVSAHRHSLSARFMMDPACVPFARRVGGGLPGCLQVSRHILQFVTMCAALEPADAGNDPQRTQLGLGVPCSLCTFTCAPSTDTARSQTSLPGRRRSRASAGPPTSTTSVRRPADDRCSR